MSEERLKILEMIKEGKITADEALELLERIPDEDERSRRLSNHWHSWEDWIPAQTYMPDLNWIDDLHSAITETARNVIFPGVGSQLEKFTFSSNVGNGIRVLIFEGKNAPVSLESYGGDKIEVDAQYKAKGQLNPRFALTEENGVFSLNYDNNALYSLGIKVRVPEKAHIGSVNLKNKNAPISIDDIDAEKIELGTKNSSIKVSDCKGGHLCCETKNAPVTIDDIAIREIDVQTTNAKISVDNVEAFRARLVTNNAKIKINDSDIVQLYAKTSNAPISIDNLSCGGQDEQNYGIDAITTNGGISINLPCFDFKCRLRASTTNGGIYSELDDLEYNVSERNYVEAQTYDYETAQNKLSLNLQTTNAKIYIKK